ncbi:hypothetical protein [Allocoleopsis sp.]|uniref:hypothetical protein n=1 Tax=Allocoleopsis sp. TaxID=3088169 RepID=UPI002FD028FA
MTHPTLLELAKQGDEQAIISVMNYLLQDKGITAQAAQKDDCLLVVLKSEQLPEKKDSVAFIHKLMVKLAVKSIKTVKIYGKQIGQPSPAWTESLDLTYKTKEAKNQPKLSKSPSLDKLKATDVLDEGQQRSAIAPSGTRPSAMNTKADQWPKWFPYPSSWFRAFILIPLMASIFFGSFIFAGVWSSLLLAIAHSQTVLFLAGGLMLLVPTLSLAYVHYFFSILWKKENLSNHWLRWLPSGNSLWQGFYDTAILIICLIGSLIILGAFIPQIRGCNSYETVDQIAACREVVKRAIQNYEDKYHLNEIELAIWVILPAYLYQAEYLIRHRLFPNQNVAYWNHRSGRRGVQVEKTDVERDSQGGEIELNQAKKGRVEFSKTIQPSPSHQRKPQKLAKKLLTILLIPLVAIGIYWFSRWSTLEETIPQPVASQTPILASPQLPSVTPSSVPSVSSESPASSQQTDPFQKAINKAMSAATLTQSATLKDDWNLVASEWQEAIALMKAVPSSHSQYTVAQQKAIEYQRNLDYAQKNADKTQ